MLAFCVIFALSSSVSAQLLDHLDVFGQRLPVSPGELPEDSTEIGVRGPKGIVNGDFDGDQNVDIATCNVDGTISVFFGEGDGKFAEPVIVETDAVTLRDLAAIDINQDGRDDLAVPSPAESQLLTFLSTKDRGFIPRPPIALARYARNIETGDFDGDGITDLAVGGRGEGLRELRLRPNGTFVSSEPVVELGTEQGEQLGSLKPVYVMESFRVPGSDRDALAVTHTYSNQISFLFRSGESGLRIESSLEVNSEEIRSVYDLAIGNITSRADSNARQDLVVVHRDSSLIRIHSPGTDGQIFSQEPAQQISIGRGPRAAKIVDLDGDGWNDLVVVLRYRNRVTTYRNDQGILVPAFETAVGDSPRDVTIADFDGDGNMDAAVINRDSSDVSVLEGHEGTAGFTSLDQIYPLRGDASDLEVADVNGDGLDDVLQVHQTSSEFSVRLSLKGGQLGEPKTYSAGNHPNSLEIADVNDDGKLDAIIGPLSLLPPRLLVRHGDGTGNFEDTSSIRMPTPDPSARVFGLKARDLDRDGHVDLAVGVYDCSGSHIVFLRGLGGGDFEASTRLGIRYAQAMGIDDFDQDGDLDFAALSRVGELRIVESRENVLSDGDELEGTSFRIEGDAHSILDIRVNDLDFDGDPDLLVSGHGGLYALFGNDGARFGEAQKLVDLRWAERPSDILLEDLDEDNSPEIVLSCDQLSRVSILKNTEHGLQVLRSAEVPSAHSIATGDLDGDGKLDLVGSGAVLWTTLSSRPAQPSAPRSEQSDDLRGTSRVMVNEVLAINNEVEIAADNQRRVDFIELYNGAAKPRALDGWKIEVQTSREVREWAFPKGSVIEPRQHMLLFAARDHRTPFHLGFKLPGSGATVRVVDSRGIVSDSLEYVRQFENVSYG
ncbi:MAG: FG-GAP-like repeat-containing protein, partial [Planctomycetota bacterium]